MNSGEPVNVTFLKCCPLCDKMHIRRGKTCSRACLMLWTEYHDFITLRGHPRKRPDRHPSNRHSDIDIPSCALAKS